jgi:hypothetical protein
VASDKKHKPKDPHNCLCDECVYESLRRMGGPWKTIRQTKREFMEWSKREGGTQLVK